MPKLLPRLLLIASLFLPGFMSPSLARPPRADWCQCVIFALNLLGIQQIPGEYWTAASLAVPDATGKTWMDYQGYKKRTDGDLPGTGDLLVLSNGAEVVTEQTWSGAEHLVPVPVAWTGHMGIVLQAQKVEKEGTAYIKVQLMSANWGVLAKNLGVVGSCYNVDQSTFLIPEGYKKAGFFQPADPVKARERMVNRAIRWAFLGLTDSPNAFVDGFPVNPSGFASYVMEPVGSQPLMPVVSNVAENLVEIPAEIALPGDFLLFGNASEPGMAVITQLVESAPGSSWKGQVAYLAPKGTAAGPVEWSLTKNGGQWNRLAENSVTDTVHFLRYRRIPGYIAVTNLRVSLPESTHDFDVVFTASNGGGQPFTPGKILLQLYPVDQSIPTQAVGLPAAQKEIQLEKALTNSLGVYISARLNVAALGNYRLLVREQYIDGTVRDLASIDLALP
jgi:hypothetical protein